MCILSCYFNIHWPVAWSFLKGSTIAKNRSADKAVRVNTDTPIDISLMVSDNLQTASPQGQESTVYTVDVNGTHVIITSRSAKANDKIYL